MTPGLAAFKLGFQLSPIILTGGLAQNVVGFALPIISITEAANFADGLLAGGENIELDDFFANYQPIPGTSLIEQQAATYPAANQAIAANAVISQPLTVSMLMTCPARNRIAYGVKLATMSALRAALAQHNALGGTYTVVTPSQIYFDCLMTGMRQVDNGGSGQVQFAWQIDFIQPLLTISAVQNALNGLMSKIDAGLPINGQPAWSGAAVNVGPSGAVITSSTVPAASDLLGAIAPGSGTGGLY